MEKEVAWDNILKTLSQYLNRQIKGYEGAVMLWGDYPQFEQGVLIAGEKLQQILEDYRQLRALLGLTKQTELERYAEKLLHVKDQK